jgi:hypothetical protein
MLGSLAKTSVLAGTALCAPWLPEGTSFFEAAYHLHHIFLHVGHIICVQASSEKVARKSFRHIKQRNDPFFGARFETAPFMNMLFRPEEIHGTSGIGQVFEPLPERDASICDQTFRFCSLYHPVFHFNFNRRSAVKTWSIDLDCFSRKKPADR